MLKNLSKKRNRKGFTLVELIVVIAILGILLVIAIPRFAGFRETAALKADQATAATIAKAAELYIAKNTNVAEADLTVESLKAPEVGLLDNNVKAQAKGKEGYTVKYDNDGVIKVYYSGEDETQLYPEP